MGDVPYDDDLPDEPLQTADEAGYQNDAESKTPSASS